MMNVMQYIEKIRSSGFRGLRFGIFLLAFFVFAAPGFVYGADAPEPVLLLTVDDPEPLGYRVTGVGSMISLWSMADVPNYHAGGSVNIDVIPAAVEREISKLLESLRRRLKNEGYNGALGIKLEHSVGYAALPTSTLQSRPAESALVVVTLLATPVRLEQQSRTPPGPMNDREKRDGKE